MDDYSEGQILARARLRQIDFDLRRDAIWVLGEEMAWIQPWLSFAGAL
jgi:hypothetical protein